MLICCGLEDTDVPPDMARSFFDRAGDAAAQSPRIVELCELEGADHYAVVDASTPSFAELWCRAEEILRRPGLCWGAPNAPSMPPGVGGAAFRPVPEPGSARVSPPPPPPDPAAPPRGPAAPPPAGQG